MEFLIFSLGCVASLAAGAYIGGMAEGFNSVFAVFFYWYAFALLGLLAWAVCIAILAITKRKPRCEPRLTPK